MEQCPENKPICLKISTRKVGSSMEKMIEKKCDGKDYVPIEALETLLTYAPKNNTAKDEWHRQPSEEEEQKHCYFFETAWLIVIKDIEKRIDLMKPVNIAQVLQNPEVRTQLKSAIKKPLDIKELFLKIIEVGKAKWEIKPAEESLAYAILTNMEKLTDSKGFGKFSDQILGFTENPSEINKIETTLMSIKQEPQEMQETQEMQEMQEPQEMQEMQEYVLDQIKSLFKMTYSIMNPEDDLKNMEYNSVEAINAYFAKMNVIFNTIFKASKKNTTVKGGRNKKTKVRRNKKTQRGGIGFGYNPIINQDLMFSRFLVKSFDFPVLNFVTVPIAIALSAVEFVARVGYLLGVRMPSKPFRMVYKVAKKKLDRMQYTRDRRRREAAAAAEYNRELESREAERGRLLEEDFPRSGERPPGYDEEPPLLNQVRSNSGDFPPPAPFGSSSSRSSSRSLPPGYVAIAATTRSNIDEQ